MSGPHRDDAKVSVAQRMALTNELVERHESQRTFRILINVANLDRERVDDLGGKPRRRMVTPTELPHRRSLDAVLTEQPFTGEAARALDAPNLARQAPRWRDEELAVAKGTLRRGEVGVVNTA